MPARATEKSPIRIIAHRGASHAALENTLAAFRLAWDEGADGIEADFRLTRDGQVVAMHDETARRTAGADLRISELSLSELRSREAGRWKGERWAGERIPTLEEVLDTVPADKRIFLELKSGPEILKPLLAGLERSGLPPGQTAILAFDESVLREAKELAPHRPALWLVDRLWPDGAEGPGWQGEARQAPGPRGSAMPSTHRDPKACRAGPGEAGHVGTRGLRSGRGRGTTAVPREGFSGKPSTDLLARLAAILETAFRIRADGLDVRARPEIDAAFVKRVRAAGLELHVWTVNDAETAANFRALGVDSMTTDRPAWLREVLDRR